MPVYRMFQKPKSGFTLIELLVSMTIATFVGGAIFVTFTQGVRIWQAAVRESEKGREEFFFEELKSDLRNAFFYGKSALNGQSQMIEFHTLVPQMRGKNKNLKVWKVPAQIRYRFNPAKKSIEKEISFYEKMLNKKSEMHKTKIVLEAVKNVNIEYYRQPTKGSSASWVRRWADTCFPEAVKITVKSEAGPKMNEARIISIPAAGECVEQEDSVS